MGNKRVYILDDGSEETVSGLMALGIPYSTARNRLIKYSDPAKVYMKNFKPGTKVKSYKLDDGTFITVKELSEKLGCKSKTAGARLTKYSDVYRVFKPVIVKTKDDPDLSERRCNRMDKDPDGFWKLFNKI